METNTNKKGYRKISSMCIITIVFIIFGYIGYDLFVFGPRYRHRVDNVKEELDDLKVYLNSKIPEIDSAINVSNKQYKELKEVELKSE
jgi:cbb3-type cytochrome oxidase subunit 3